MSALTDWLKARATEVSTYTGLASIAAAVGVHIALPPSDIANLAAVVAGVVGAVLVLITTKNPQPLIAEVVKDIPVLVDAIADANAAKKPAA